MQTYLQACEWVGLFLVAVLNVSKGFSGPCTSVMLPSLSSEKGEVAAAPAATALT